MAPKFLITLIALFSIPMTAPDGRAADAGVESQHVLKGRIIRSLAIDPEDANHVLVGQKGAEPGSALVFRTRDGGETWQTLNGNQPLDPNATDVQAVAALSGEVLLAGTWKHGLYRSSDGGRNFVQLSDFPSLDIRDLQIADGVIYAATGVDGVFSSADGGDSWEALGPGKDFLWSLTAADRRLFASSPGAGVFERDGSSWKEVFTEDKAYASASSSGGPAWQAVAGETGLYVTSDDGWLKFMAGDKLADVLIIDETRMLTASWSDGVSVVMKDGTVQRHLLEGQPALHLQLTDDQLLVGTWGKGLHILPLANVLP